MDLLTDITLGVYRLELQKYLNEIFNRPDIFNCQFINDYFEFNQFIPQPNHCTLIVKSETVQMEIFDICFSSDHNILLCSGGRDIPVISSFSKINSLFSYFDENGFIKIYRINNGSYGEVKLDVLLNKRFPCQISKILYHESNHYVTLGFFNGAIEIYDFDHLALNKVTSLKPHSHRIINIYCDYIKGYVYSAAYDENVIIISEINYQRIIATLIISNSSLNSFALLNIDQKIICADDDGSIWIYQIDINKNCQIKLLQAIHGQLEKITALNALDSNNLIFIANAFKIGLYEYKENIKNSIVEINQRLLFESSSGVNSICYKLDKGMIITGCENGTVQFWTNNIKCPEYVLEAHSGRVSCFMIDQKNNLLFTGSYDKTIKIWMVPTNWTSELYRKNKLVNDESVVVNVSESLNTMNILKEAFSSDEFRLAFGDDDKKLVSKEVTPNIEIEEDKDSDNEENSLDGWDEVQPQLLNNQKN